jgi:predicted TPR repeat methyltransferase
MPPETDSAAPPAPLVVNDYDSFAAAYTAETEANLVNGYYMRPAIVDLAGNVAGRRILDAGCGSGPISAKLRDKGAIMTGFDSSAGMLELARQRLGPDADLHLADLAGPCRSPTTPSMTSSRAWCCTTWRTGPGRWPSCGGCCGPAAG